MTQKFHLWRQTEIIIDMRIGRDGSPKEVLIGGIPGWRSGLAPAFGPGRDPGEPGSNPTSGSRCMEPASPSAYVSASLSLSLCDYQKSIKIKKNK